MSEALQWHVIDLVKGSICVVIALIIVWIAKHRKENELMKWDKVQADMIKKLMAVDNFPRYVITGDSVEVIQDSHIVFRVPAFYMRVYMSEDRKLNSSFIDSWVRTITLEPDQSSKFSQLDEMTVEICGEVPVQIFRNLETGEMIKVNRKFYSGYTQRADQLTFWGTDRKSPVLAVNGPIFDKDNIVFLVLPINYAD